MINSSDKPFINILDKGYRYSIQAWKVGSQILKKPVFDKSDKIFKGEENISSASIAANRSGNERTVKRAKESFFFELRLDPGASFELIDDICIAWHLQVNFMFEAVL